MAKTKTLQQIEADIENLIAIQCTDGNWDQNEYMRGMANGLMIALSCITGEEPNFLDPPEFYQSDLDFLDKFNQSSVVLDND